MRPIIFPVNVGRNYHYSPRNDPEECSPFLLVMLHDSLSTRAFEQLTIWRLTATLVVVPHRQAKDAAFFIYSTNIRTEYFKHAAYSPFFSSSKCCLFHNATFFGSCIIHILYTECAKI